MTLERADFYIMVIRALVVCAFIFDDNTYCEQ